MLTQKNILRILLLAIMVVEGPALFAASASIPLREGWNLISFPLDPENKSVEAVLGNIGNRYQAIYGFDGSEYSIHIPGDTGNTLNRIDAGRGYWLLMDETASLTINGNPAPSSVQLKSGWNLAGYNSLSAKPLTTALSSIAGKYGAIYSFETAANSYRGYAPGALDELTTLEPGKGYWIYATENVSWTLPADNIPNPGPGDKQVGQWDRFEETISNTKSYSDPYSGVTLEVTYTKPDGKTVNFWGFYDGGTTWKIRFMPDQLGPWKYEAKFSDGTAGKSGTFHCVSSTIPGLIHRDEHNPRWFGFKGGKHVLIRSLHAGPLFLIDDAKRKAFLDWAAKQGYNLFSSGSHLADKQGPKVWPLNAAEYRKIETVLNDLSDRRMMVYGFAGFFGNQRPWPKAAADQTRYIKYCLARFGPYWNEIWNVGGPEPNLTKHLSSADINRLGAEIKKYDVFDHLLGIHNPNGDDPYRNQDWVSMVTLQVEEPELQRASDTLLKNYVQGKPVYGQEDCWMGNDKQFENHGFCNEQRIIQQMWVHMMAASAFNAADNKGSGGSGFTGSLNLSDKIQIRHDLPKLVWDFMETVEFWRMNPHQDLVSTGYCLAEPGRTYLVYLPTGGTVNVKVQSGKTYTVKWVNGRNPSEQRNAGTTTNGQSLAAPDNKDWVLSLSAQN
jgi:hypothetical protein